MVLSAEWIHDTIIMAFTLLFVTISIILPKYLKEKGVISKHLARKLIHSFSGLAIFSAPYLNHPILAVIFSSLMVFVTRMTSQKSKAKPLRELFDAIGEEEELHFGYLQGPFAYCLAITLLVFIFTFYPDKYYYPINAVLIMMYSDTAAAVIGRKYGKHHIHIPFIGNKRTIEGSITFLGVSLVISIPIFYLLGQILPGNSLVLTTPQVWILSISMSFIATILELFSPSKYDDLIIPLGTTLFTVLFAQWVQIW